MAKKPILKKSTKEKIADTLIDLFVGIVLALFNKLINN